MVQNLWTKVFEMRIIEQLKNYRYFTVSEQAIIEILFREPEFIKTATSQELAKKSYTSSSTISRLCQKLGCKNFHDFSKQLISEMEKIQYEATFIDASIPFQKDDNTEEILRKITCLQSNALSETLSLIEPKTFEKAVDYLTNSKCIHIWNGYEYAFSVRFCL